MRGVACFGDDYDPGLSVCQGCDLRGDCAAAFEANQRQRDPFGQARTDSHRRVSEVLHRLVLLAGLTRDEIAGMDSQYAIFEAAVDRLTAPGPQAFRDLDVELARYQRAWEWLAAHPECVLTSWGTDADGNPMWRVHDSNDPNGCPGQDATYYPTPLLAVEVEATMDEVML